MDEQTTLQVEALVRRARGLAAEIREMTETKKAIESRIESLVPLGWKSEIDSIPAQRKLGNRSFNRDLAIARMTQEQKLQCVTTGIDDKMVRAIADSQGWTEECMVEPDPDKTRLVLS